MPKHRPFGKITVAKNRLVRISTSRNRSGDATHTWRQLIELLLRSDSADLAGGVLHHQAWLLVASGELVAAREAITESIRLYGSRTDQELSLADRFASHAGMGLLRPPTNTPLRSP